MPLKNPKLTPFEKAVYGAVMTIPPGATRSYKWVAMQMGSPGSARAVGNALNKNPYAPYVPCHRVVASDGSLGGYSGGVCSKRKLLKQEKLLKFSQYEARNPKQCSNVKNSNDRNLFI
ncbi:MAG: MGMT family protein [Candidatus Omnitrophica bacterium]|nr:MGMT family protein [Candidatus Omnitrophota bacterium]